MNSTKQKECINEAQECINEAHLKLIYSFTYRLSGKKKIAEKLTEKVFLTHLDSGKDELSLLKQAWLYFYKDYEPYELNREDAIQQSLLALAPAVRCALILRDILGYSYGQIAIIIEQREPEVAHLIHLGRRLINLGLKNTISNR
ncbi:MAG: hypothetical protein CVU87_05140 [Firmicutes bacterium HGW-Firmicutes-12]|jgi:DNA-directed RNA polymerase specialized sigma24 family protein|nr:MAG: hypothetical protein CVU87_05140 [Firmicutes bacterium HGW-Firmicutes-12]